MRLTALITGALIALFACAHRSDTVTMYQAGPGTDDDNPNYQNTRTGGDSDMGSAGGESYASTHAARTMSGEVPDQTDQSEYYEASKNPKDAGSKGGADAGSY